MGSYVHRQKRGIEMKIVIVGSEGFIGRTMVRRALMDGNEVVGVDIPKESPVTDAGYTYRCVDSVDDAVLENADGMVLLAAKRPIGAFTLDDYFGNIGIIQKNLELAIEKGITNIVFASSISVYSGEKLPWTETDYSVPLNLYGASKLACENIGLLQSRTKGLRFKALRFGHVIGPNEKNGFFVNLTVQNAREKKTQTIYGTGEQKRHYIAVPDVCAAVLCALKHPDECGVYNIGMARTYTNNEVVETVNRVFQNAGNAVHDLSKQMIGGDDGMSIAKAQDKLGFAAAYDLEKTFLYIKSEIERS